MKFKIRDNKDEIAEEEIELWIERDPRDEGIFFKGRHSDGSVVNICTILTRKLEVLFAADEMLENVKLKSWRQFR